jgi:porphobilinogen synthase
MLKGHYFRMLQTLHRTKILAYSAKDASSLYSPFGMTAYYKQVTNWRRLDKSMYQVGYANPRQVAQEILDDIQEGADMVIVKSGLAYLFSINGERNGTFFSSSSKSFRRLCMIKAAAKRGWIDEEESKVNCFCLHKASRG